MTQLSNGCSAAAAKPLAEKNQHYGGSPRSNPFEISVSEILA
jgi:hypothetical protein